jgi:hypothetical protein
MLSNGRNKKKGDHEKKKKKFMNNKKKLRTWITIRRRIKDCQQGERSL